MPSISTSEYKRILRTSYSSVLFSSSDLRDCRTFEDFEYLIRDKQRIMPEVFHFTKKTLQRAWNLHVHIQTIVLNSNSNCDNNQFLISTERIKELFNCANNSIKVVLKDVHKVFAHMRLDGYNANTKMYLTRNSSAVRFSGIQNLNNYIESCFSTIPPLQTITRGPSTTQYTFPLEVELPSMFTNPIQNMNPNIVFALTSNL